jgi:hypothetical protein
VGTLDGNVLTVQHVTSRGEKRLDHRRITITLPAWWPQEAQVCVRWVRGRDPECWVSPVVDDTSPREREMVAALGAHE